MYKWITKRRVIEAIIAIFLGVCLFFAALNEKEKNEEEELLKTALLINLTKKNIVEDGEFVCDNVRYKVTKNEN